MVLEDFSLHGKVALITGGGSGIGGGITQGLAEAGAAIACVYHHHEPVEMQRYVEQELGGQFWLSARMSARWNSFLRSWSKRYLTMAG